MQLWDRRHRQAARFAADRNTAGSVNSVAFSPDGSTLASAGLDGTVEVWDVATDTQLGSPLTATAGSVSSVAFSPDRRTLAFADVDGTVRLWDVTTHSQLGLLAANGGPVTSVVFSPDGRTLASASQDGTVRLWDVATGRQLGLPLSGDTKPVTSVVFSPDGRTLASASQDGTVRLWDVATGGQLGLPLAGNAGPVIAVAFSQDGRTLASASEHGTIRLWSDLLWNDFSDSETRCAAWSGPVSAEPNGPYMHRISPTRTTARKKGSSGQARRCADATTADSDEEPKRSAVGGAGGTSRGAATSARWPRLAV